MNFHFMTSQRVNRFLYIHDILYFSSIFNNLFLQFYALHCQRTWRKDRSHNFFQSLPDLIYQKKKRRGVMDYVTWGVLDTSQTP